MMSIGIQQIGCYRPADAVNVVERGRRLGISPEFITSKLGFRKLLQRAHGEDTSDLCVKSFEDLLGRGPLNLSQLGCLAVVTQGPDGGGIPHTAAVVHRKLGLAAEMAVFDISLGCSGFVQGLSIMCALMAREGIGSGLLFTADPYSKIVDPEDRNTALLFGDAATCTLLSDRPRFEVGRCLNWTQSSTSDAIRAGIDRRLSLDGNAVYRFVARTVGRQILQCVEAHQIAREEVDFFLVHQGSRFVVDAVRQSLGVCPEKVPFLAADTGNTVSSSIPLALEMCWELPLKRVVISGFGVGLSSATLMLKGDATV
jgi:3-oxoacyl-[acyl-carrier-protein] synthase-3